MFARIFLVFAWSSLVFAEHTKAPPPRARAESLAEKLEKAAISLSIDPLVLETDAKEIGEGDCRPLKRTGRDIYPRDEKSPLLLSLVDILAEEKAAVEARFPQMKEIAYNDSFWAQFSIEPSSFEGGFEFGRAGRGNDYVGRLLLADFTDRRRLRLKIYEKALTLMDRHRKEGTGENPLVHNPGGYLGHALLSAVFSDVGVPSKRPLEKLSIETAAPHAFFHRVADELEAKDARRADCLRRSTNRAWIAEIAAGNPRGSVSPLAVGEILNRFKHAFGRTACFDEKLFATTTDPRALRMWHAEKDFPIWSLAAAMGIIEKELPDGDRAKFAKLRETYGLDEKSLLALESYALRQSFQPAKPTKYGDLTIAPFEPTIVSELPPMKGGVAKVEEILQAPNESHRYRVTRTFDQYALKLGPDFPRALGALGADDHWIDAGSGEGRAILDYQTTKDLAGDLARAQVLADLKGHVSDPKFEERVATAKAGFAASRPAQSTGVTLKMSRKPEENARHFTGRFFEEIPDKELGQANLITDVVGVFAYSNQVDVVLEKYFGLLKPGGTILISTDIDNGKVRLKSGRVLSIFDWVKTIPGIKAEISGHPTYDPKLKITITDRAKIKVPKLKLIASDSFTPPTRLYRED